MAPKKRKISLQGGAPVDEIAKVRHITWTKQSGGVHLWGAARRAMIGGINGEGYTKLVKKGESKPTKLFQSHEITAEVPKNHDFPFLFDIQVEFAHLRFPKSWWIGISGTEHLLLPFSRREVHQKVFVPRGSDDSCILECWPNPSFVHRGFLAVKRPI